MAMTLLLRRLSVPALLLATLGGLGLAASATRAWAHDRPVPPSPVVTEIAVPAPLAAPVAAPAPSPPEMAPLAPAIALGLGLAVMLLRRRACVMGLALVFIVLALETGVHSVHHLADQQGAAECVVALATAQMHGIVEAPPADHGSWIAVPVDAVLGLTPERPGSRLLRPDEGRAPPAA